MLYDRAPTPFFLGFETTHFFPPLPRNADRNYPPYGQMRECCKTLTSKRINKTKR